MRKSFLSNLLKIAIGFVLCHLISLVVNYLIGYSLFELSESNLITIERTRTILEFYVITYLGFLIPLIIIAVLIFIDFLKGNKSNILWKLILIVLFYLSFEFRIISMLTS